MSIELRIVQIEDVLADAELELRELRRAGMRVVHRLVETEEGFREALREFRPELILSDFSMPHFDGMFALALARELAPDVPFIFVSGTIGEEYAIRALKNGATDYVLKNNLMRLPTAVERALKERDEMAARRVADARHRATFDNAPIGIMHTDIQSDRILHANPKLVGMLGYAQDELRQMKVEDVLHPDHRGMDRGKYREKMLRGEMNAFSSERKFVRKGGAVIWGNRTVSLVRDAGGAPLYFIRMVEDISERKLQDLRISRLNRIHEVLSGINSAIVRIRDRRQLFEEACRIAVEHGKFTMSWIGMLDVATQEIRPVAKMGREDGYLERLNLKLSSDNTGNLAMAVEAIALRTPVLCNDIANDGRMRPWRAAALERGYRASATFPLMLEKRAVGVFVLYAPEPGFFDDEEMKLLTELAGDISFALEHISGQERIEKLSRVRVISSEINAAIVRIRNRQQLFEEACRIAVQHGNFGLAWIGLYNLATLEVIPVASAGLGSDEMRNSKATVRPDLPQGQGVLGRAIRGGKPVFDNDITVEKGVGGKRRQEALRLGYHSLMVLPLFTEGAVAGILALFEKEANFFDEEEIELLTELAGNISFALEHIAKESKLEKLSRIRDVSGEINAAIVRIHEREALMQETCRIAATHGKFEFVWVALLDPAQEQVLPVAWTGFSPEAARAVNWASITATQGTLGEAIQKRKASVRNDLEADLKSGKLRQEALEKGCRSTVCLPLVVDESVAALIVLFAAGRGFFDADELVLLNELAADVSFALQSISRQEKFDYLSYYDPLTGLPNRALFNDRLEQRLAAARDEKQRFAVMMLDIERFRLVNDTFGRQAGDELLRQVSQRLKNTLQSVDLLANTGGNHFAIATRRAGESTTAAHLLEQALTGVSGEPFKVGESTLRIAARAGVALYPADGTDVDTLLRNAEAALDASKKSGQRYQFYAPQMNARVAEQLKLENDLRNAIEQEQYILHYQPRLDLISGQIVGMEALIRWQHPVRGLVPPGEFIPLLEETGMILDVGRWALRRAASQHAAWSARGRLPPRIAVNVSLAQLKRHDFIDQVKDALAPVERAAERVDLEITESMLMEDIEGTIGKLKAMQALGLHIALDDFGTGFSSLSYLARLPINSLKVDRSFVMQMSKGPEQMAIVATVVSLARALNLKVVAEGVETEEQTNLLRLLRCDEAQGFLFGRPVPADEMEGMLRQA